MQTVIRDENGKIQYIRGEGNYYLKEQDFDDIRDTTITAEMVSKTFEDCLPTLTSILDDKENLELLRIKVLNCNGFDIQIKRVNFDEIV